VEYFLLKNPAFLLDDFLSSLVDFAGAARRQSMSDFKVHTARGFS
jgi:hypothetical protein